MRIRWMVILFLGLLVLGMGWMGGCTKSISPVVPTDLPTRVDPTPTF